MVSAYKYRLYPNRKQEARMLDTIEACRRVWNMALEDRKGAWQVERQTTTYEQQCRMLTVEAKANPQLEALYSQVRQDVLNRLDKAFQAFFKGDSKYPRFKKYRSSGSFTYPQAYKGGLKLDAEKAHLPFEDRKCQGRRSQASAPGQAQDLYRQA